MVQVSHYATPAAVRSVVAAGTTSRVPNGSCLCDGTDLTRMNIHEARTAPLGPIFQAFAVEVRRPPGVGADFPIRGKFAAAAATVPDLLLRQEHQASLWQDAKIDDGILLRDMVGWDSGAAGSATGTTGPRCLFSGLRHFLARHFSRSDVGSS